MASTSNAAQDLVKIYEDRCSALEVRKNSAVVELLKNGTPTRVDFSVNIVGSKGLLPVLEVLKLAPSLTSLSVSNNRLCSPAAVDIATHLTGHPNLSSLDVSDNHLPLGGEPLLALVKGTPALTEVKLDGTQVRPLFTRLIELQLKKNKDVKNGVVFARADPNGNMIPHIRSDGMVEAPDSPQVDFSTFKLGAETQDDSEAASSSSSSGSQSPASDDNDDNDFDEAAHLRVMQNAGRRRQTVSSEVISQSDMASFSPKVVSKPVEVETWLAATLEHHHLFSHLEDSEILLAVRAMEQVQSQKGESVFEEGADGSLFVVLYEGGAEETKNGETIRALEKGDTAADTAVLYQSALETSLSITTDAAVLFSLDRCTYRHIATKSSHEKRKRYSGFLQKISFLEGLELPSILQLADALKTTSFHKGDVVMEYGSEGKWFHIIVEGTVEVVGRKDGEKVQVCHSD